MDNVIVHKARVCANKTSARGCTELYIKGGSKSLSSIALVSQSVAKGILLFSWATSLEQHLVVNLPFFIASLQWLQRLQKWLFFFAAVYL